MASLHWWTSHFCSCSSNVKIFTVNSPPQAHLGCLTLYERFLFLAFDCLTQWLKTIEPSQTISHSPVCPVDFPWYNVNLLLWWGHFQKTHANFQSSYVIGSSGVSTSANLCLWMSLKYATVPLVMPQCFFLAYVVYLGSAKPDLAIVYLIFNISHGKYLWEKLKSTSNNFQMFHSLCKEYLRIIITRRDQSFHYWLSCLSGRKKQN